MKWKGFQLHYLLLYGFSCIIYFMVVETCAFSHLQAVRLIVEDALLKYSADRTGLPDYALESAGTC